MDELVQQAGLADPRFADHESLKANAVQAFEILWEHFESQPLAHWRAALDDFSGQWSVMQDTVESGNDPQNAPNHFIQDYVNSEGEPFQLALHLPHPNLGRAGTPEALGGQRDAARRRYVGPLLARVPRA